jgi:predicted RNA-binding protein YlqC (UPF0109 family)
LERDVGQPWQQERTPRAGLPVLMWEGYMKQLISEIVKALVDKPDEVQIKEVIGEHAHVLELSVAKEDLGKVIGKQGRTARAIRALLTATAGRDNRKARLEILD